MAYVEIDRCVTFEPEFFLINDAVNRACRNVPRHQVAVLRIPLLEKIKALFFRNALAGTFVSWLAWDPNASAFAASRFAHQAQLVFPRDRRRMNLDELAVRIVNTLLKQRALR